MTLRPRYNLWAVLWALTILVLCLLPGNEIPRLAFLDWLRPDKIVHFIMFGLLSLLLIGTFLQQDSFPGFYNHAKLYAVLISSAYGGLVEFLQHYIVSIHRSGEVFDVIADTIGALIGLWCFNYLRRKKVISINK